MKDATPVYPYSAAYARGHGELDAYRTSHKENVACKQAIEAAIREHYRDNSLSREAALQVIEQFGLDRVQYILANTVRQMDWDGRISNDNKAWAGNFPVYEDKDHWGDDRNLDFVVAAHPGLSCEAPFPRGSPWDHFSRSTPSSPCLVPAAPYF